MPGCPNTGEYRAPKSRTTLTDYWWFCLDHVRAYNAVLGFLQRHVARARSRRQLRADTAWQRPTWPLGRLGGSAAAFDEAVLRDPLGAFAAGRVDRSTAPPPEAAPSALREPLSALGLNWPVTLDVVKTRYKELAKRHHPDANGGDRAAEERLKTINLAYAAVRNHFHHRTSSDHGMAAAG